MKAPGLSLSLSEALIRNIGAVSPGLTPTEIATKSLRNHVRALDFRLSQSAYPTSPDLIRNEGGWLAMAGRRPRLTGDESEIMASEAIKGHQLTGPPSARWLSVKLEEPE